jgi:hypothetical protein
MSLSELRKELKEIRKKAMPVPVSRMKKTECAREIERLKGIHSGEVKKVEEVMKEEKVPAKVAKTVKAVQEKAHKKGEEVVKKTKGPESKSEAPKKEVKKESAEKPAKGSEEMKARMAALRAKRAEKKV